MPAAAFQPAKASFARRKSGAKAPRRLKPAPHFSLGANVKSVERTAMIDHKHRCPVVKGVSHVRFTLLAILAGVAGMSNT